MPVEKVQSKWDLENEVKARATMGSTAKLDEILPTTKVVMWPKVSTCFFKLSMQRTLRIFLGLFIILRS